MQLSNNKILITGGNKGIGLALAEKFMALNNTVIVTGRNVADLDDVKRRHPAVFTFQCDLSKAEDIDKLTLFLETQHPDLNILINNAGVQYNYDLAAAYHTNFKAEHEIKTNLLAPIKLIFLLLPLIQRNGNSAIVNVSSALAFTPKKSAPVYCATKAGIHVFTKALRYQLSEVKVFEIIPPLVATKMTAGRGKGKITPETLVEEFIKKFKSDHFEMNIGKVKALRLLHRIFPRFAERLLRDQ